MSLFNEFKQNLGNCSCIALISCIHVTIAMMVTNVDC